MKQHYASIALSVTLLAFNLNLASAQEFQGAPSDIVIYAQPNTITRTELVPFGDLNLAAEAGRQAFIGRVEHAATRVCGGPTNDLVDLIEVRGFRTCRDGAMADARPKMEAVMAAAQGYPSVAALRSVTGPFN
jgi:UrcA family protein